MIATRAQRAARPVLSGAGGGTVQPYRGGRTIVTPGDRHLLSNRALPPGHQWKGHCGKQAQARELRRRFRIVEKLRDIPSQRALIALHEALAEEANAGEKLRSIAGYALARAEEMGMTWAEIVMAMIERHNADKERLAAKSEAPA